MVRPALVVQFRSEQGILHPSDEWQLLGTIFVNAYGGDAIFRGIDVTGANIGWISELTLATPDDRIVGEVTYPVGACSCGSVRLMTPRVVADSDDGVYEVWGRIPAAPEYPGELTFNVSDISLDAEAADGGPFSEIIVSTAESRFRVWETSPVIVGQALASTSLINGVEQDLFKIQVSSDVAGESFWIGSLTVRFASTGGTVSDLHVYLGSARLSTALFRLVHTSTGEEISPTDPIGLFPEQVTVVFTETPGLLPIPSGEIISIRGTPSGYASGDSLRVLFGDRVFSYSLRGVIANMTPRGSLTLVAGDEIGATDPIVWTTRRTGIYTGAWEIEDLTQTSILSR
ncbi:MAG: hypothetical protein AAB668_02400 [Patescibacteria group bacterium]